MFWNKVQMAQKLSVCKFRHSISHTYTLYASQGANSQSSFQIENNKQENWAETVEIYGHSSHESHKQISLSC